MPIEPKMSSGGRRGAEILNGYGHEVEIRHIAWHRRQGRKVRASRGGVAHFAALHVSSGTKRAGAGAAAEFGDVALLHKPIHSAYLRSPWIRQRDVDEGASEGGLRGGLSGPLDFPLPGRAGRTGILV